MEGRREQEISNGGSRSIAGASYARRLTRLFTLRQWKGANEIAIKPKLWAHGPTEREKEGVGWSGRQQISPDDFHFQRTNYSPSPCARSFVSAAFANKSAKRNGCVGRDEIVDASPRLAPTRCRWAADTFSIRQCSRTPLGNSFIPLFSSITRLLHSSVFCVKLWHLSSFIREQSLESS